MPLNEGHFCLLGFLRKYFISERGERIFERSPLNLYKIISKDSKTT